MPGKVQFLQMIYENFVAIWQLYATCVHGIILCHGDIMANYIFFVENFDYVWNHEIVITGFESKLIFFIFPVILKNALYNISKQHKYLHNSLSILYWYERDSCMKCVHFIKF